MTYFFASLLAAWYLAGLFGGLHVLLKVNPNNTSFFSKLLTAILWPLAVPLVSFIELVKYKGEAKS